MKRLDKKIRENLRDPRNSLFVSDQSTQISFQRPLLILLDRNFDLATPLHHTWTYQALLHDCFDLKLNRVDLTHHNNESASQQLMSKQEQVYDLLNTDKFWKQQKGNPFPNVAESIQEELDKFKQCEEKIKSLKDSIVKYNLNWINFIKNTFLRNFNFQDDKNSNEESLNNIFNNTSRLTSAIR